MRTDDTICAISSAIDAASGRVILRISGPSSFVLLQGMGCALPARSSVTSTDLHLAPPATMTPGSRDKPICFPCTVYAFGAPRSFTGDHLIELHLPGSPFLARRVLDALLASGARQAEPGEFTARAYLNGKLDLAAAEGVAATIAASSRRQLDAARQLLAGELARRLRPGMDLLSETLALVEVAIDFTDEGVTFLSPEQVGQRLHQISDDLRSLLRDAPRFERLSHQPRIVLAGRPNAGKSTLINLLSGQTRAVVSDIAGTTRDALSARAPLAHGIVALVDVAGIDAESAADSIAAQMQRSALAAVEQADLLVLLHDCSDPRPPLELARRPHLFVWSKSDLATAPASRGDSLAISARSGAGIEALRTRLDQLAFGADSTDAGQALALNARHVDCIESAIRALQEAEAALNAGDEFTAHALRRALDRLGDILGVVSPDELLGQIFSRFCIGK